MFINKENTDLSKSIIKKLITTGYEDYAYGWFVNKRNHVYHGGQYYHTTTHFHLVPESNIGIVLSVNTNLLPTYKWSIVKEFIKTIN